MPDEKKPFWETLPGLFTGLAAVITATAGLLALFIRPAAKPEPEKEQPVQTVAHSKKHSTDEEGFEPAQIQGVWRDTVGGLQVKIVQRNNKIRTETYNPLTGQRLAVGTGEITGNFVNCAYTWYDGTPYTAALTIDATGREITGNFRNAATGQMGPGRLVKY